MLYPLEKIHHWQGGRPTTGISAPSNDQHETNQTATPFFSLAADKQAPIPLIISSLAAGNFS